MESENQTTNLTTGLPPGMPQPYRAGWMVMRAGGTKMWCPFDRRRKSGREWCRGWDDSAAAYREEISNAAK